MIFPYPAKMSVELNKKNLHTYPILKSKVAGSKTLLLLCLTSRQSHFKSDETFPIYNLFKLSMPDRLLRSLPVARMLLPSSELLGRHETSLPVGWGTRPNLMSGLLQTQSLYSASLDFPQMVLPSTAAVEGYSQGHRENLSLGF